MNVPISLGGKIFNRPISLTRGVYVFWDRPHRFRKLNIFEVRTHFCLSTSFCKAKNTLEYIVSLKRQLGFMLKNILECLPSTSFAELFLYFTTDKRKFLSPAAVIGKTLKIVTSKIAKINFEDNRAGEVNFCDLKIDCDFTAISQVSNKVIFQV